VRIIGGGPGIWVLGFIQSEPNLPGDDVGADGVLLNRFTAQDFDVEMK
jgi:hypothetical protein